MELLPPESREISSTTECRGGSQSSMDDHSGGTNCDFQAVVIIADVFFQIVQ